VLFVFCGCNLRRLLNILQYTDVLPQQALSIQTETAPRLGSPILCLFQHLYHYLSLLIVKSNTSLGLLGVFVVWDVWNLLIASLAVDKRPQDLSADLGEDLNGVFGNADYLGSVSYAAEPWYT
jgi:hypothetical protein